MMSSNVVTFTIALVMQVVVVVLLFAGKSPRDIVIGGATMTINFYMRLVEFVLHILVKVVTNGSKTLCQFGCAIWQNPQLDFCAETSAYGDICALAGLATLLVSIVILCPLGVWVFGFIVNRTNAELRATLDAKQKNASADSK